MDERELLAQVVGDLEGESDGVLGELVDRRHAQRVEGGVLGHQGVSVTAT